jgi:hypothetical protein
VNVPLTAIKHTPKMVARVNFDKTQTRPKYLTNWWVSSTNEEWIEFVGTKRGELAVALRVATSPYFLK